MPLPSFCRDEITVVRAGVKDSRGVQIRDWDNATTHKITGCSVQPTSTESNYDIREGVVVRAKAYLPPDADIKAGDRVEWQDKVFAVDGQPLPINSPTGRLLHIKATLTDWEG